MIVLAIDVRTMTESGVAIATASAVIVHGLANLLGLFMALALASTTAFCAAFRWSVLEVRLSNCLQNYHSFQHEVCTSLLSVYACMLYEGSLLGNDWEVFKDFVYAGLVEHHKLAVSRCSHS